MKMSSVLLLTAFIGGSNYFSKNPNTPLLDATAEQVILQSGPVHVIDTLPPAVISAAFTSKYPTASNINWYRYTPSAKVEAGHWYSGLDGNDYYVCFSIGDAKYIAWYDDYTWVYTSHNVDKSNVPGPIMRALNAQFPGAAK